MGLALAQRQRRAFIGPRDPLTPILLTSEYTLHYDVVNCSLFSFASLNRLKHGFSYLPHCFLRRQKITAD